MSYVHSTRYYMMIYNKDIKTEIKCVNKGKMYKRGGIYNEKGKYF